MKKTLLVFLIILLMLCCASVTVLAEEATDATDDLSVRLNEFYDIENLDITSISIVSDKESYMIINGVLTSDEKDTPWSGKFTLTEEQYLKLFHVNESVLVYEKTAEKAVTSETVETILEAVNASKANLDVDVEFKPAEFTRNIKYMGLGMLGIFVVVAVVIVLTFVLNKVTTKKE